MMLVKNTKPSNIWIKFWLTLAISINLVACSGGSSAPTAAPQENASAVNNAAAVNCGDQLGHWVSAWADAPSDASVPLDGALHALFAGANQSFRLLLAPLGSGNVMRLHFSNRFGTAPITLNDIRVAASVAPGSPDIVAATSAQVTFSCASQVTIPAGADVVSDPVSFNLNALQTLAVSVSVANTPLVPTRHFIGRQVSFATYPGAGDHTADAVGSAFTQSFIQRPLVDGIDVRTNGASAVVALGDSITDGYQGTPLGVVEDTTTINLNQRYPDFLKRRIDAAKLPFFVANVGIAGNRVLQDGAIPQYGPSALHRLNADVLAQAGVGTVIFLEGINDIGLTPGLTATALEQGYTAVIGQLHAADIKVLQGTLTPCGSNLLYGTAANNALRDQVNAWIRTQSPADGVVDFDLAVRDPNNPDDIAPQYDGGDGLHFTAAGYQRMADAVDLSQLTGTH